MQCELAVHTVYSQCDLRLIHSTRNIEFRRPRAMAVCSLRPPRRQRLGLIHPEFAPYPAQQQRPGQRPDEPTSSTNPRLSSWRGSSLMDNCPFSIASRNHQNDAGTRLANHHIHRIRQAVKDSRGHAGTPAMPLPSTEIRPWPGMAVHALSG